jgi:AraC family transcriptional activator of pobA
MNSIPVHKLQDKTDRGFLLKYFTEEDIDYKQSDFVGAHRDDHYMFFIMMAGSGSTIVDFEEKVVSENQLYYILPEQIHYRIKTNKAKGWFIAVDPSLVEPECRNVFESWLGFQEPVTLSPDEIGDYDKLLSIIYRKITNQSEGGVSLNVLHALFYSFFQMAASNIRVLANLDVNSSRPAEISMKFKKLLNENIRAYKSPSDYADMLYISEPYLNEALKKITGSPVSFWIKYKIMIEAKRLLFFSDLTVKQIANDLGFENHSYFSRFFSKEAGITALTFRNRIKDTNSVSD